MQEYSHNKNPDKIKEIFNNIADNYDLMNNIITLFIHKKIKKDAVKHINAKANKILDICTGTGDIAGYIYNKFPKSKIIAIDFSEKMLQLAKKKNSEKDIEFIQMNAEHTSFPDNYFDVCITGFGLRNIPYVTKALQEFYRILKNGGQLIVIDLFKPNNQWLYSLFLNKAIPFIAKIIIEKQKSYEYLIESINEFYSVKEISKILSDNNFIVKKTFSNLFSTITTIVTEKAI